MKCHSLFRKYLLFQATCTILTEKHTSFAVCPINSALSDTGMKKVIALKNGKFYINMHCLFFPQQTCHPDIKFKSN